MNAQGRSEKKKCETKKNLYFLNRLKSSTFFCYLFISLVVRMKSFCNNNNNNKTTVGDNIYVLFSLVAQSILINLTLEKLSQIGVIRVGYTNFLYCKNDELFVFVTDIIFYSCAFKSKRSNVTVNFFFLKTIFFYTIYIFELFILYFFFCIQRYCCWSFFFYAITFWF